MSTELIKCVTETFPSALTYCSLHFRPILRAQLNFILVLVLLECVWPNHDRKKTLTIYEGRFDDPKIKKILPVPFFFVPIFIIFLLGVFSLHRSICHPGNQLTMALVMWGTVKEFFPPVSVAGGIKLVPWVCVCVSTLNAQLHFISLLTVNLNQLTPYSAYGLSICTSYSTPSHFKLAW